MLITECRCKQDIALYNCVVILKYKYAKTLPMVAKPVIEMQSVAIGNFVYLLLERI